MKLDEVILHGIMNYAIYLSFDRELYNKHTKNLYDIRFILRFLQVSVKQWFALLFWVATVLIFQVLVGKLQLLYSSRKMFLVKVNKGCWYVHG